MEWRKFSQYSHWAVQLFAFGGTFSVLVREFFLQNVQIFYSLDIGVFLFFAGKVRRPKPEPDHHFHFVTNLRMNGALPLLIFYDFVTHTRTVFSAPFVLDNDLGSKNVG